VSVIMTLRVSGDPDKMEQFAQANPDAIRGISERAQAASAIAHRFYGSEGQIMVVDEWPDPESFHRFFEAEAAAIGPMMEQVGAGEPEITSWRKLETGDDLGWE
jgi:quinol monooxygenase YgiN